VFFEEAPVRIDANNLVDDGRILKLAIRQPNLDDAEILFGRNGYSRNTTNK
jgi:hypothetical protein